MIVASQEMAWTELNTGGEISKYNPGVEGKHL